MNVLLLANELALQAISGLELTGNETQRAAFGRIETSLNSIMKASQKIIGLAEHLTNFSRGMQERLEVLDLAAVIKDSLFITQNKITGTCIRIDNGIERGRYFTMGVQNQLEQVFVNLISNACDAMAGAKEGALGISVSYYPGNGQSYWKCDIADTGPGISEATLENIFHSFYTTKERGAGTGLGLSIARGIVENHEGQILVDSTPGLGATFSVILPATGMDGNHPASCN
jgi:signal transduction histidine kinase